jgi:hypothetical protein
MRSQPDWNYGLYFCQEIESGAGKLRLAAASNPLSPQHCSLDLVWCKHQWRHVEATFEHIAYARLTSDWNSAGFQSGDVPVNRALRRLQLRRDSGCGNRASRPSQQLHDLK